MNRRLIKYLGYCLMLLVAASGCRKLEDINTDPARPSETAPQYLLANAEKRAADIMYNGYYNGRIGMHFAQYWTGTDKTSESRNLLTDDGLWAALYTGPLMDLQEISNYYTRHPEERNEHTLAIAGILKAWIFHVLTDIYVSIPCRQALQVETYPHPEFDKGEDVYSDQLALLQTYITALQDTDELPVQGDVLGNGNPQYWIRFANALRMRMALRMADVQPERARAVLEDAAQHTLTATADDIYFPYNNNSATNRFPYNDAERPLIEIAVTATLIDYLRDAGDPRLPVYARPAAANGEYRGKPYGFADNIPAMDSLSMPGIAMYSPAAKGYLITYAEVAFIKAEAAARGMNAGGSAASFYEEGVRASMQQWGITDDTAVSAYLARVPYNAGSWKNVIGTQKWIALYMQGLQSWMERLRLDFSKPDGTALFIDPVSGSLDPEVAGVPQRLTYPNATRNTNPEHCEAAAQQIGGDSKATKNWWNIN